MQKLSFLLKVAALSLSIAAGTEQTKAQTVDKLRWIWERNANDNIYFCVFVTTNEAFTVDWGDGTLDTFVPDVQAYFPWHIYLASGTYTVTVVGSQTCHFTRLYFSTASYDVTYISIKSKNCTFLSCRGAQLIDGSIRSKLHTVDITKADNPNMTGMELQRNRMRLDQCYNVSKVTINANTYPQFLDPRVVAKGDTIDFSADTTFIDLINGRLYYTTFEVFKKDSMYPPLQYGKLWEQMGYCKPADPGNYIEAKGILAFYKSGEYIIKMTNPAVMTATGTSIIPAEVYQQILLPPNNDACLASLSVSEGVLTPVFECDTLHYTVNVGYPVQSIIITALPSDTFASVTGDVGLLSLQVGGNLFSITVTAEDGINTKVYTVVVNRAYPSVDASLARLTVTSEVGEKQLIPVFNPQTLHYTTNVAYNESYVIITAAPSDTKASVSGDLGIQLLKVGSNHFSITVTAEDGITTKTYTVVVNRAYIGVDASLASLKVESETEEKVLTPVFDSQTLHYTTNATSDEYYVIITATPSDFKARVSGDVGIQLLKGGNNYFFITVTAEDGVTAQTYTLVVNRTGVGIAETDCNAALRVYPNPTTGELQIKNYELREDAEYQIFSVVGQVVMQGVLSCRDAACYVPTIINVESLAAGLYFLKIDGKVVKFVKE